MSPTRTRSVRRGAWASLVVMAGGVALLETYRSSDLRPTSIMVFGTILCALAFAGVVVCAIMLWRTRVSGARALATDERARRMHRAKIDLVLVPFMVALGGASLWAYLARSDEMGFLVTGLAILALAAFSTAKAVKTLRDGNYADGVDDLQGAGNGESGVSDSA